MATMRRCRECGCHDRSACWGEETGACWWVEPDLCSACSGDQPDASRYAPINRLTCDGDKLFGVGDPATSRFPSPYSTEAGLKGGLGRDDFETQGSGPVPIEPKGGEHDG